MCANGPAYFPKTSSLSVNYNCLATRVREKKGKGQNQYLSNTLHQIFLIVNELKTVQPYTRSIIFFSKVFKMTKRIHCTWSDSLEQENVLQILYKLSNYFMTSLRKCCGKRCHRKWYAQTARSLTDKDVLYRHRSASLGTLIKTMNTTNLYWMPYDGVQQQVQKKLFEIILSIWVLIERLVIVNDRPSRDISIPPNVVSLVFSDMYGSKSVQAEHLGSLSIAGIDGHWEDFSEADTAGNSGKTGSLIALVSRPVFGQDGDTYSVVIFMNNLTTSSVHAAHSKIHSLKSWSVLLQLINNNGSEKIDNIAWHHIPSHEFKKRSLIMARAFSVILCLLFLFYPRAGLSEEEGHNTNMNPWMLKMKLMIWKSDFPIQSNTSFIEREYRSRCRSRCQSKGLDSKQSGLRVCAWR